MERRTASGARRVFAGQRLVGSGVTEDGRERDPYSVTDDCHDGEDDTQTDQNRDEFQWTSLHLSGSAQPAQPARLVPDVERLVGDRNVGCNLPVALSVIEFSINQPTYVIVDHSSTFVIPQIQRLPKICPHVGRALLRTLARLL